MFDFKEFMKKVRWCRDYCKKNGLPTNPCVKWSTKIAYYEYEKLNRTM